MAITQASEDFLAFLEKKGLLSPSQHQKVASSLPGNKITSLPIFLVEQSLIPKEKMDRLVAEFYKVPLIDIKKVDIPPKVLELFPEQTARTQKAVPFRWDVQGVHMAMSDPGNLAFINDVGRKASAPIKVYYSSADDIDEAIDFFYRQLNTKESFDTTLQRELERITAEAKPEDLSVIKVVENIINFAFSNRASDVHIEPHERNIRIRFRIDGILHTITTLPQDIHRLISMRIKVLARLKTDEHQRPQDGKFRQHIGSHDIDVRVSIVPIVDGEKIVLRLLAEESRETKLEELGLTPAGLKVVKRNIHRNYGMILSTGPTGSGKTSSLYAMLNVLNTPEVNITTIEDPVEYKIEGVNQIHVNNQIGLDFANGLRSILRQDPDIIMVGEIRDTETAAISINASLTGHLVLSTLHTTNSATAFPRLIDMGIKPFLIASSVNLVIAQRLVRTICQDCAEEYEMSRESLAGQGIPADLVKRLFGSEEKLRLKRGRGCRRCGQTGYIGRIGIFEFLEVTEELKSLIIRHPETDSIRRFAMEKQGMRTLIDDGIDKVKQGITTVDELMRISLE